MSAAVRARLQELYASVLVGRMGLSVGADSDGDLVVELADGPAVVQLMQGDPAYLRMYVVVGTERYESLDDAQVAAVCAVVTQECKGAKAFPVEGGVLVAVELVVAAQGLLPEPAHLAAVLPRVVEMLRFGAAEVAERLELSSIAEANGL